MSRWLERLALLILLTVIGIRPLISESYDSGGTPFTTPGVALADASPVRTVGLDLAVLGSGVLWLVARALDARLGFRRCGLEIGVGLVVIAAVVSCVFAGQKRLAINATLDWLCLLVLTLLLVQLLRRPWRLRLALCVILAGAAANAAECFYQVTYSFAETEREYYAHREARWAAQGVSLDSPQVELFERRMKSREATAYMWHSNVAGAYLMLAGFAAAGLAWSRWRGPPAPLRRVFAVCGGVIAVGLWAAAGTTRSTGALVAGGSGVALLIAALALRRWIGARRSFVVRVGWACVVGGVAAVIGHGLWHGSLPGPPYSSLNFRWQYWTTAAKMIADHPLTGVGMENFGRHYVQYKPISAPEEIKSPHNFVVSAAADWGVPGLLGMLIMLVGGSVVLARPSPHDARAGGLGPPHDAGEPGRPLRWMILLGAAVFVPRCWLLGSDDIYYVVWMTSFPLLVWGPVFIVTALDGNVIARFSDDPLPRLPLVLNCGLVAFLLSDLLNFALFVPAAATTFFALAGVALATRAGLAPRHHSSLAARWGPVCGATAAVAVVVVVAAVPVLRLNRRLAIARNGLTVDPQLPLSSQPTYSDYLAAMEADALDPTPAAECARYARAFADVGGGLTESLTAAVALVNRAIERDPFSLRLARDRRTYCLMLAQGSGQPEHYEEAVEAALCAVSLYPTSPDEYIALGDCYAGLYMATDVPDEGHRCAALDAYEQALRLDDARPEWEVIRRLPPTVRAEIDAKLDRLRHRRPLRAE